MKEVDHQFTPEIQALTPQLPQASIEAALKSGPVLTVCLLSFSPNSDPFGPDSFVIWAPRLIGIS